MNFEFINACEAQDEHVREAYAQIYADIARAEGIYWAKPRECGMILRNVAERICHMYNYRYEIGFHKESRLEEFLCYSQNDEHNAMVSRFLSVVRKEQRDRLNRLRILGDDCIWADERPGEDLTLDERMAKNAKHMMEIMIVTTADMCVKISGRTDLNPEMMRFDEGKLPEQPGPVKRPAPPKKSVWTRIFQKGKK